MPFNIPKEADDFLSLQIVTMALIGFLINIGTNGQATILHLKTDYDITPDTKIINPLDNCGFLNKYAQNELWRVKTAKNISIILYFIVSPLISYYYAFFIFPKMKKPEPIFPMGCRKYIVDYRFKNYELTIS